MAQDINSDLTHIVSNGFNINMGQTETGIQRFNLGADSGFNYQVSDSGVSTFNPGQEQSFTLGDTFKTSNGNSSEYIKHDKEIRSEGDYVIITGSDTLLQENLQEQWYTTYQQGWGVYKEQLQPQPYDRAISQFAGIVNLEAPKYKNIKASPPLIDGDYSDNLTTEAKTNFIEKFSSDGEAAKEATKQLQENLNIIYNTNTDTVMKASMGAKYTGFHIV